MGAELRRYLDASESLRQKLLAARNTLKPAVFEEIRARVVALEGAREESAREARSGQGMPVEQVLERVLASMRGLNQGVEALTRELDELIGQG